MEKKHQKNVLWRAPGASFVDADWFLDKVHFFLKTHQLLKMDKNQPTHDQWFVNWF